jgi:hypothetical protein
MPMRHRRIGLCLERQLPARLTIRAGNIESWLLPWLQTG